MKKTTMTLLLAGLLVQTNAQLRDVMLKKAGEKLKGNKTEKTGSKTENTTTENTGTTENQPENEKQDQNTGNPFAALQTGSKKDIQPAYQFEQNVLMEMRKYDKKGNPEEKNASKMRMHFGKEPYSGMESYDEKNVSTGFMIYEPGKNQMVMLMENEGSKIAMVHKVDPSKYAGKEDPGAKKPVITKTGRTKKVCGYHCEEWTSTDENGEKTEMWISTEVPIVTSGFYSMFNNNKEMRKYFADTSEYPTGMMMEMTHFENNGEKFTMTATEVNVNAPKTVETAGYLVY